MKSSIAVDLYCGLGGWCEGLHDASFDVIGFDIERHDYGTGGYPGQLVLQDVLTLHGSQFRNAALIVASPPCTEYSYMAMPWRRSKQIAAALCGEGKFPARYSGSRTVAELNTLFDACFRIQREACEAGGRHIPMVVENVRGAQKWVGRAKWHYGSYYLWGDVPALMPSTATARKTPTGNGSDPMWNNRPIARLSHQNSRELAATARQVERDGGKSHGLNWSDRDHKGQDFTRVAGKQATESRCAKVAGFRFDGTGGPFQSACVVEVGTKLGGNWWHDTNNNFVRRMSSKSSARKAASAIIAKIPYPLARWIGDTYMPRDAH